MRITLVPALALLALPVGAVAQPKITIANCDEPQTQLEMTLCASQKFQAADADLNAVWPTARAAAKMIDDYQPEDRLKGADAALLAAQRAWISYRDDQCELASFLARGGTMEPMLVAMCKADLTVKRTAELKDFVDQSTGN